MNNVISQLTYSLFKKNSLDDCTVDEIKKLADRYPYFSSLQLLLSKKMLLEKHSDYRQQAAKASLYYNNPVYFNHILHQQTDSGSTLILKAAANKDVNEPAASSILTEHLEQHDNDEWVIENKRVDLVKDEASLSGDVPEEENLGIRALLQKEIDQSDNEMELAFGPIHTVDYFASQGIESRAEEKPADRFSIQLKSFTEWLKELKKIPPDEIASKTQAESEEKIISMAEHSLDDKDILTESMAAVWLKQGDQQKAIDIYTKLSLINPSKSAYFASLIEKIKD